MAIKSSKLKPGEKLGMQIEFNHDGTKAEKIQKLMTIINYALNLIATAAAITYKIKSWEKKK